MNKFASGIFITLRGYHGKGRGRRRENRFRKTNPAVTEQQLYPDVDEYDQPNEHDFDDVEKDEANFMAANRAYTEHMREKYHEKEKVKVQIIARKYFKPDDPNFITWTEKMQIKSLYAKDPVEWSPERLSESFPALPDTIRRILRANWQPKNAQTVVNYDTKVIENWNKFKSGNIAVSSKLEAHLQQFKGRKIEVADLETIAEKFVRPKPVFPEPKATLFKSIVQDFIQPLTTTKDIPKISDGNENRKLDFSKLNVRKSRMNFDTFVKTTVEKIDSTDNLSLEVQLLVGEYKKKKDEETLEISDIAGAEVEGITVNNRNERTPFEVKEDEKITMQGRNIFSEGELLGELFNKRNRKILEGRKEQKKDGKMVMVNNSFQRISSMTAKFTTDGADKEKNVEMREENRPESRLDLKTEESKGVEEIKRDKIIHIDVPKLNLEQDSLATGIIEWKKKEVSGLEDYPQFIKIPKHKTMKQITFKVQDCYYDCDGEFLYRVPGLKPV